MKLTIMQIYNINEVLTRVFSQPLNGLLTFKLYRIKQKIEMCLEPLFVVLKSKGDEQEVEDILKMEEEVAVDLIEEHELGQLTLSMEDILFLQPLIRKEETDEKD